MHQEHLEGMTVLCSVKICKALLRSQSLQFQVIASHLNFLFSFYVSSVTTPQVDRKWQLEWQVA